MSYNGRRVLGGQEQSGYRGRSNTPARVLFFPALFVYLYFMEDILSGIQLTELK